MALTLALEYGENFSQSIDLNELLMHKEGTQALSGLTGTGLPPVQVQWLEGAGDGAKFRGRRVLARPIDLPLYTASTSRRKLKALARELSIALGDECRLRLRDSEEEFDWIANVVRTGGGDFVYGEDTTGEYDLSLVVTLQAGNPFWLQDRTVRVSAKPVEGGTEFKLNNPGSAPAFPKWTLTGPGIDFTLTSSRGQQIVYGDLIDVGEQRIIDTESAQITDQDGVPRYDGVAGAPSMFSLPPGRSTVVVTVDQTSDSFLNAQSTGRTNFAKNPSLRVAPSGTDGWSINTGSSYDSGTRSISKPAATDPSTLGVCSLVVDGLTPGVTYRVVLNGTSGVKPTAPTGAKSVRYHSGYCAIRNGTIITQHDIAPGTSGALDVTFVAAETSVTMSGVAGWIDYNASDGTHHIKSSPFTVSGLTYVGDPGDPFDGATPDTADTTYLWSGTADASTSRSVRVLTGDELDQVLVTCEIQPRDWMVV